MKILKIDPSLIRKPKIVMSCTTQHTIDLLAADMVNPKSEHFVTIVSHDGNFVAVDNIDVLDAAINAKISKINAIHIGKADPLLTHLKISTDKFIANPARVAIAVRELLLQGKNTIQSINLDAYFTKIAAINLDEKISVLLADTIDKIFLTGVKLSPPISFFSAFLRLDIALQKTAIEKTLILCEELKVRFFVWPDANVFKLMLVEGKNESDLDIRESVSRGIPSFNCVGCGMHYGVINDEICNLEEKDGCLIVKDRLGNPIHPIPDSDAEFLGIITGDLPRFSRHKSIGELKDLKLDGPFLLVRLKKKK